MFCAFDADPLILRLYGRGRFILPQDADWDELSASFMLLPGTRQIFLVDIESVQTSCGWGVPLMTLTAERETLSDYHRLHETPERLARIAQRTRSIDGLSVQPQDRFPARG